MVPTQRGSAAHSAWHVGYPSPAPEVLPGRRTRPVDQPLRVLPAERCEERVQRNGAAEASETRRLALNDTRPSLALSKQTPIQKLSLVPLELGWLLGTPVKFTHAVALSFRVTATAVGRRSQTAEPPTIGVGTSNTASHTPPAASTCVLLSRNSPVGCWRAKVTACVGERSVTVCCSGAMNTSPVTWYALSRLSASSRQQGRFVIRDARGASASSTPPHASVVGSASLEHTHRSWAAVLPLLQL
eukprot:COSAG03_NODE_1274_length_4421_cov_194.692272_6_plen_244_part_00